MLLLSKGAVGCPRRRLAGRGGVRSAAIWERLPQLRLRGVQERPRGGVAEEDEGDAGERAGAAAALPHGHGRRALDGVAVHPAADRRERDLAHAGLPVRDGQRVPAEVYRGG